MHSFIAIQLHYAPFKIVRFIVVNFAHFFRNRRLPATILVGDFALGVMQLHESLPTSFLFSFLITWTETFAKLIRRFSGINTETLKK